jgi:glyoxylase-like metal-dependent hydrolase (beta-lactamase superfamily II)
LGTTSEELSAQHILFRIALAAGCKPEQVDEIYITHMYPDHVGGLMTEGSTAFPSATTGFDSDNSAAHQQRMKAFEDAAKGGYIVGVTHMALPGLGNLRPAANGKGYFWVPLNYSSLK